MLTNLGISIPGDEVEAFCRRWHVQEFSLFGSVLNERFAADSDVDVLVTFAPGVIPSFKALDEMEKELEALFERSVDLVDKVAIQDSPNYIRRNAILGSAQVVYAS
jgi:predicted nucleotidyltransferase